MDTEWSDLKLTTKRLGRPCRLLPVVTSTNAVLRAEVESGIVGEGAVLVTDHQTAGRGRLGRRWKAPPGRALLFSVCLEPNQPPIRPSLISLMASMAVVDGLIDYFSSGDRSETHLAPPFSLKWPNDILSGSAKLCGILCETGVNPSGGRFIIVGIGLNVNQRTDEFPSDLQGKATSLFISTGKVHPREVILNSILTALDHYYQRLLSDGDGWIAGEWFKRAAIGGRTVVVRIGDMLVEGMCLGLTEDGALRIRDQAGTVRLIYSGVVL